MKLGDALWKVERPVEEMERISKLLKDESSLNYRVFEERYRGQKLFDDICKSLTRTITGFRPTSDVYRKRVRSVVLKDLRENKPRKSFWLLYQTCVADFVISDLPALNQLLGDTELPEDFQPTTEGILAEIADRALDYSVHDRDLESLYVLWPFPRTPKIAGYLNLCPKFDRFRAIDEKLRAIESRLKREVSDVREHTAHDIDDIRTNLQAKVATKVELNEAIEASHRQVKQAIDPISQTVERLENETARVREIARRLEARWIAKQQKAEVERAKEFGELNQAIGHIRNEQLRIAETLEQAISTSAPPSVPYGQTKGSTRTPFALFERVRPYASQSSLSVEDALEQFLTLTSRLENASNDEVRILFYSALVGNCVVVMDQMDWSYWESATGWPVRKMTTCASPLWVDEDAIGDRLSWLFDQPEEPRCLEILDFDRGYMDGYLSPFVRAWSQSDQQKPWKKLLLVPSEADWSISDRLAQDLVVLPRLSVRPSANDGNGERPVGMLAPSDVRRFLQEVGFECRRRSCEQDSGPEDGGTGGRRKLPGLLQMQILRAMPLAEELTRGFGKNLELLWSEKAGD